jgi:hypothetical protein
VFSVVQNRLALMLKRPRLRIFCTTEKDEASLHREKQKELFDLSSLKRFTYLFLCVALLALCGAKSFGFK